MSTILKSKLDKSVNFVEQALEGFLESRYVRKCDDYFVCYLSSHTGCNRGCKFCHLTTTKQTSFKDSDYQDYLNQALQVYRHYRQEKHPAKYMHYSFMARGEALANKHLLKNADDILFSLGDLAKKEDLGCKFNISTIMPTSLGETRLEDIFQLITPTIYYSMYSVNEKFRKKWLPSALPVKEAIDRLASYQSFSKKLIKIHFAFIDGENDSENDVHSMLKLLSDKKLAYEFNLVRYNPFSEEQGMESSEEVIQRNLKIISENAPCKVQEIPRVGFDVHASCGTFVPANHSKDK